jgi:hypothetical protein
MSRELIEAAEAAGVYAFGHPDVEPASGPFSTIIWLGRIENLKTHLRIIQQDGETSEHPGMQRMARQAAAGIAEADRYLAEPDWDSCPDDERRA